eukprot:SAG31_NODE_7942_length_1558_cov_2.225497_2_plen_39_part_01
MPINGHDGEPLRAAQGLIIEEEAADGTQVLWKLLLGNTS